MLMKANNNIDDLKNSLPSILSCADLKKESATSYCGPCPVCCGTDRFVYKTDSKKCWCRECHDKAMDKIDFHCWLSGKSLKDLFKKYLPEQQEDSIENQNSNIQEIWDDILRNNTNEKPVYDLLCDARKLSKKIVKLLFDTGLVRFSIQYQRISVAIPYTTLEGAVLAIQYLSVDGEPFPFTLETKPANKVFIKGSKPGKNCYFMAGVDLENAKILIICESPINAITASQCYPEACCIALGGSTYTKKVKALKKSIKHIERIILCFDNDSAGEKAVSKVAKIIGVRSHSVQWPDSCPEGYDVNDILQAGDIETITDMITDATIVKIKKKEKSFTPPKKESEFPTFYKGVGQLREQTEWAWDAICKRNDPPVLFDNSMGIVSVQAESKRSEKLCIKPMTADIIRNRLTAVSDWFETRKKGEEIIEEPIPPLKVVCVDMLVDQSPPLPYLKRIMNAPFFMEDGTLHKEPGYSKESQCILEVSPGLSISKIPHTPTNEDVKRARILIYEMIGDFPFTSQAERAHAIALMILPFVREMITGRVPLHLVEASTPGTGKTLLVIALTYIFLGQEILTMTEGRSDEEYRKKLTAKLISEPPFIFIDNVRHKIDSSALAAALTCDVWEDRLLGQTKMVNIPVNCGWIATGNNPSLSSEMARRTIRVRLDAHRDRPWERVGKEFFKHPDLIAWVKKNRGDIIGAVLIIIQAWITQGCPAIKEKRLGGFESWSDVMGGILTVGGIPGFLENSSDFYEDSDAEGSVLRSFISAWYQRFGGAEIGVSELFDLIIKDEIPIDIGNKSERSQKTTLGKILVQTRDRRFDIDTENEDGDKIKSTFQVKAGKISHKAQQWKLLYKPQNIKKGEPQNICSPIGSPIELIDFIEKGEHGEHGEPKTDPQPLYARTREKRTGIEKSSLCSPCSPNLTKSDGCKGGPIGEPQNTGSPLCQECKYTDKSKELCYYLAMTGKPGKSLSVREAIHSCPLKIKNTI